jgi:hypothetical protein
MAHFHAKKFQGVLYTFEHLNPMTCMVELDAMGRSLVRLDIVYSTHCFTESFDELRHQSHHRYTIHGETRAFDLTRYQCSVQLPILMKRIARVKVYKAMQNNYTYVAHINREGQTQPYSIFFKLKQDKASKTPLVRMYVQSAYTKSLTVSKNAQSWRFGSLLGQLTGLLEPAILKNRPKKKAP